MHQKRNNKSRKLTKKRIISFLTPNKKGLYKNCINQSGGPLGGNAPCATGLIRIIEACKQLKDDKGKIAIATGQIGMCAQGNIAWVLEKGGA